MYLYIISLVVITTFAEESVVHNTVNVELVKQGIAVLQLLVASLMHRRIDIPWRRMR
jgi:hypothetical protein